MKDNISITSVGSENLKIAFKLVFSIIPYVQSYKVVDNVLVLSHCANVENMHTLPSHMNAERAADLAIGFLEVTKPYGDKPDGKVIKGWSLMSTIDWPVNPDYPLSSVSIMPVWLQH